MARNVSVEVAKMPTTPATVPSMIILVTAAFGIDAIGQVQAVGRDDDALVTIRISTLPVR